MYGTLLKAPLINHPLHTGHAPAYLVRRMIKLLGAMSRVIIDEYGEQEFLRRLVLHYDHNCRPHRGARGTEKSTSGALKVWDQSLSK